MFYDFSLNSLKRVSLKSVFINHNYISRSAVRVCIYEKYTRQYHYFYIRYIEQKNFSILAYIVIGKYVVPRLFDEKQHQFWIFSRRLFDRSSQPF